MKDYSLLAALVAPSARQFSTQSTTFCCGKYSHAFSPTKIKSGANCGFSRHSLALRAETIGESAALPLAGQEPAGVYEAVLPQTETLVGMGFILVLCVALYWVWENQVVPVSRTNLAISKNRGEVKEYLDELKASAPSSSSTIVDPSAPTASESIFADESSVPLANASIINEENFVAEKSPVSTSPGATEDRAFERWLFTDWLQDNKYEKKGGRRKEPALPILKDARWNSGDNPVVVAAFLMLVGIVFTSLTERIASFG